MNTQNKTELPVSVTCNIGALMSMLTPVAYCLTLTTAAAATASSKFTSFNAQYQQPAPDMRPCKMLEEYAGVLLANASAHDFFIKSSIPIHNPILNGGFGSPDINRVYAFLINTFEPRAYYEWVNAKLVAEVTEQT